MTEPVRRETASIEQARMRAGVSRRTIYNWMRDHKVAWVRTAGGSVRIYVDTLLKPDPDAAPSERV